MNEGESGPVRVLVSCEVVFCEAIKVALEREPDLEVVAESQSSREAVAAASQNRVDVALLDARLPWCGVNAIGMFGERAPACRLLFLADEDDDEKSLTDVLEAGASGLLTRDRPFSELVNAVRSIHRGEMFISQRVLGPLVAELVRRRKDRNDALVRTAQLTRREREVLSLLAQGLDTNAIARALVISPETARTHVQHVLCKLGVHSRLEAAALVANTNVLEDLMGRGSRTTRTGE